MRNRVLVIGLVVAAFAAGEVLGSMGLFGLQPAVMVGDASVGQSGMTIMSGGTAYGAGRSMPWRDGAGTEHPDGWPDCLASATEVKHLRFAGAFVGHDGGGTAEVLWVDCSGR